MKFQPGDKVIHQFHGEGVIASVSSSGAFAVVRYPISDGRHYHRTHATLNLEKVTA